MSGGKPPDAASDFSGEALAGVHRAYRHWLGERYDTGVIDVVLAAAASEKLAGDPVWLLVVGGSGAAKTETIAPLAALPGAHVVSTLTGEAALLSATPAERRAKNATGGLLKKAGARGLIVVKDFTSILSMHRDTRASVLAALREVYDGHWTRHVGADGGLTFSWRGRLVLIGACTTAWDAHHSVVAQMGDRFALVRFRDGQDRFAAGLQAVANVGDERAMRGELAAACKAALGAARGGREPSASDAGALIEAADLVTRCRTPVERDYRGDPAFAHALELPTRFSKQLLQLARGGLALGMTPAAAQAAAARAAADSMPPQRLAVLRDLAENPWSRVAEVSRRARMPWRSASRTLEELDLLGALDKCEDSQRSWTYAAAEPVIPALKALTSEWRHP